MAAPSTVMRFENASLAADTFVPAKKIAKQQTEQVVAKATAIEE